MRTEDIANVGVDGVVHVVMNRVNIEAPVYLSVDIDILDPGIAPGTGAPEVAGWTVRELGRIFRGFQKLNVVGADILRSCAIE